jgi:hypothetical protein
MLKQSMTTPTMVRRASVVLLFVASASRLARALRSRHAEGRPLQSLFALVAAPVRLCRRLATL